MGWWRNILLSLFYRESGFTARLGPGEKRTSVRAGENLGEVITAERAGILMERRLGSRNCGTGSSQICTGGRNG